MERTLYMLFFSVSFIMLLISVFYTKDWQLQGIFACISFIAFAGLGIQSLNIEIFAYDGSAWAIYQTPDYYLYFGLSWILSIFSLLNGFVILTTKSTEQTTSGLKWGNRQ